MTDKIDNFQRSVHLSIPDLDFENFVKISQDAIYQYDIHTQNFLYANTAFRDIFRLDETAGAWIALDKVISSIHPDDRALVLHFDAKSIEAGPGKGEVPFRLASSDGTIRWLQDRWVLSANRENGRPQYIHGIIRDITEMLSADKLLIHSRHKSLIGSFILQDGKFCYINPEFARITGYSEIELIGTDPMQIVHEDYRDFVRQNAISMLKGCSDMPYMFCVRDKKGQTHWVLETVISIVHKGRHAVLGYFMDVTELKRLQGNLSSLGLMVGTVSHSLKGCITGMDAGLYLIETGFYRNKPARIEEGLDVAKLMIDRINKLVQNILYYSKERELILENYDVWAFAQDIVKSMETRIRAANITFETEFSNKLGKFRIDFNKLRPAMINILENAMEACIEDTRTLSHTIRFYAHDTDDRVVFEISDNGPGMDPDRVHKIFQLFYSSKSVHGTGLGLFITRNIVRQHGGNISVESTPGQGAHFVITLPRH
jgi:PAS domain S-box-containing protein